MADNRLDVIIALKDQLTKPLDGIKGKLSGFQDSIDNAAGASRTLAVGIAAGATAIGGLGYVALKAAGDAEQTRIAFSTMLGSAEKADSFIKDLVNFAKTTPFELKGLEQSSKALLAYGFEQKDILPNLKALGDIASGVGMEKLPNLILAFGQVKAATKLTGNELRQFTEAGVPLLGELANVMGKPVSAIQEMVSAGAIGFPLVQQALQNLTGEGGRFNDLMSKQSASLGGMVSNLADSWDLFLRGQGKLLIDWAKQFVLLAQDIVTNVLPVWMQKIQDLTKWFSEHTTVLYIVAGAIVGALLPAFLSFIATLALGAIALAPWLLAGALIGGLVAGIIWIVKNWDMLSAKATEIFSGIAAFFSSIWETIKGIFSFAISFIIGYVVEKFDSMGIDIVGIFNRISSDFSAAWGILKLNFSAGLDAITAKVSAWAGPIKNAFSGIWSEINKQASAAFTILGDNMKAAINWVIGKINDFLDKITATAQKGAGIAGLSIPSIPHIPLLAQGGIITRPTLAMVGEAGPEAVIPLSKNRNGFGGLTLNIIVNGDVTGEDLIDRVGKELLQLVKMSTATV